MGIKNIQGELRVNDEVVATQEWVDSCLAERVITAIFRVWRDVNNELQNANIKLNNLEGITQIDWGDGTVDSKLNHSYTQEGNHICKIYGVVTSIGSNAFSSCASLRSIVISDSVQSIGGAAFGSCDSLTNVVIPDSVQNIGIEAFAYCNSLTSVEIGDSVQSIGNYAFECCTSLKSIVIPDSVQNIGKYVFADCDSLTIYCEAASQPSGWNSTWNSSNCPVIWGYKDKNKPAIVTEVNKLTAVTENLTDTSIPFWLNGQFQPLDSLKASEDGKQVFLGTDDGQKLVLQDNQLYLQDKLNASDPRKAAITARGGVTFDNFLKRTVYGYDSIDTVPSINSEFGKYDETQRKRLKFPNKSGTIAIAEDIYTKTEIDAGHYGLPQLAGFTIEHSVEFTYNGMSCTGIRYAKGTNKAIVFDIWRTSNQTLAANPIDAVIMKLGRWNSSGIRLDQLLSISSLGAISEYKNIYPIEAHWVVKHETGANGFQFNNSGFVVPQIYDIINTNGQATVWGMGVRFTDENADSDLVISGEYIRVMLTNFE